MLYSEKLQKVLTAENVQISLEESEAMLLKTARNYPSSTDDDLLDISVGVLRVRKVRDAVLSQPAQQNDTLDTLAS